jgi:preprotein translocase subunit SecG
MFLYHFLLTIHVIACILMILVVLLQTGRGAGLNVFGGGGDSLINTPSGSSFMKNFTSILAGTFAFTSLFLTLLSGRSGMSSVTGRVRAQPPVEAPQVPPVPPPPPPAPAQPNK